MSELDGRLKLETIDYIQVGWDAIHNSNMQKLNGFVEGLAAQDPVLDKDLATPPVSPSIGDRYIVGTSADGDWNEKDRYVTEWNGVEWRFTAPMEGMHAYVLDESLYYLYESSAWSIHEGLTPINTDTLPEGSTNLYFSGKTTDDLTEGSTNLYDTGVPPATTDDLTEGSTNLYHIVDVGLCQGRLTLTTGVPVTTSDVTAAGNLYFTPYHGNGVALYSGTSWKRYSFTEVSLSLTLTSGKNYDVFLYDNVGTLTLELSDAWTDDTTRANALALQDGVYVKSGATTRRWLGTIRASGTDITEDSAVKRFVWNAQNRVDRRLYKSSTTSHTYNTATRRQWNNDTANQVAFVHGLALNPIFLEGYFACSNSSGAAVARPEIGLDRVNDTDSTPNFLDCQVVTVSVQSKVTYFNTPALGYHFLAATELPGTTATTTFINMYLQGFIKG